MDLTTVLREIDSWPVEDRVRLVHAVWDGLVNAGAHPGLTESQKAGLDRRLAEADADPDNVLDWEAIKDHVSRRR